MSADAAVWLLFTGISFGLWGVWEGVKARRREVRRRANARRRARFKRIEALLEHHGQPVRGVAS